MDSRISPLITAAPKAFGAVSDPVKKTVKKEPEEKMKTFGAQKHCALDRFKPYQRPKLSHAGKEAVMPPEPSRQTEGATRVGCSAWLAVVYVTNKLI